MCGYCVEELYFSLRDDLMFNKKSDDDGLEDLLLSLYLQESDDISKELSLFADNEYLTSHLDIILCKILERLIFFGPSDPVYNNIIQSDFINKWHGMYYINLNTKKLSQLIKLFKCFDWKILFASETILNEISWHSFSNMSDILIPASEEALNIYFNSTLKENDISSTAAQIEIKDLQEEKSPELSIDLYVLLPVFYFSLIFLSSKNTEDEIIELIALTQPAAKGPFDTRDIWLQRRAFQLMVEKRGLEFIYQIMSKIRFQAIYYVFFRFYHTGRDKIKLLRIMKDYYDFLPDYSETERDTLKTFINFATK